MAPTRNTRLEAVVRELGWSQDRLASRLRRVAAEQGANELLPVTRSHVSQWLRGVRPSGRAPAVLCETLSRGLGRAVTLSQIGLTPARDETDGVPGWDVDTLSALADHGGSEMMNRRELLGSSLYSVLGTALPSEQWWDQRLRIARDRPPLSTLTVTRVHVDALREATSWFSNRDQRLGGRAGRAALAAYLRTDVADCLAGRCPDEQTRRALVSAAGEAVYVAGWMDFDSGAHGRAQANFRLALALSAEAGDGALAGHVLRAAAHQAVDLGHPGRALEYAEASMAGSRYGAASHREKALFGVVHARALAAAGRKHEALAALLRAEDDLRGAGTPADSPEPTRVHFFTEGSLAHEAACTLRDLDDLPGAEAEFERSVRTRPAHLVRTHAVTLGYLGDVQARRGHVDAACDTWHRALDAMAGIQSGRTHDTVTRMRSTLSPIRTRGKGPAAGLDQRAREFLQAVG
ncbi:Tat pathway signal protein [Kitasatospora sp. NPDC059327]|uniref:Tat pathway signal protein n=1 Tax=Kitasatospora sp. NPDC059327 TaxID=3346803 RepID=UPI00368BB794